MKKEVWMERRKGGDFQKIGMTHQISPILARIIRNREIVTDAEIDRYLNGTLEDLYDPHLLSGIEEASTIILRKIGEHQKIRVIGDYDIDGVNATYILLRGLEELGADVDYEIPDRLTDGYGLNLRLIELAFEEGIDTIVTCDNGISANDQIRYAKKLGMTVVVTDHHEPLYEEVDGIRHFLLPPADVLVDPKLQGDTYPFKEICGAVVAWKLIQILYEKQGIPADKAMTFLPFAAFATVGDVMDLREENRIIVKHGLKALQETTHIGMRALIEACGLTGKELSAYHIGFVLGPCINAAGRLDTATRSLQLLLSRREDRARQLAEELKDLNEDRKQMTAEMTEEADRVLLEEDMLEDPVYCLYLPACHESIAGIVAGKVREKYNHPTLIITNSSVPGELKGSGRSIEEYSMFEHLVEVADLFLKFGGHPMAAGFSLKKENYTALRKQLNARSGLDEKALTQKVRFDAALPLSYLSIPVIDQLSMLEPCGKGNEKPLFAARDLKVERARLIGKNQNMIKFQIRFPLAEADGLTGVMDALYFGDAGEMLSYLSTKYGDDAVRKMMAGYQSGIALTVTYYPSINEYMGRKSMQIVIQNYR